MIHYDEYGNDKNKTIVFLHEEGIVDSFCKQYALADNYHIVVPHLFGAGKEVEEIYNPKKQVMELKRVIGHLAKDDIILVGYSLGAGLAVMLVEECPQFFSKVVFCSPSMCDSKFTITIKTIKAHIKANTYKLPFVRNRLANYMGFDEEQRKRYLDYAKNIAVEQYRAWYWNAMSIDECVHYRELEIPMLSICGDNDDGGAGITAAELANSNPNCRIVQIKNSKKHYPARMADEFNTILLEFLEKDIEIIPIER
ncbi:MAG: alpha/beta hydrolase [Lachnospiraceae bacterium]|nr:alpha/beta hydrolase [Lachnospiraceae bacterium]